MWPDLELIGLYPSRFSGLYFTGKEVFPFSIPTPPLIYATIRDQLMNWEIKQWTGPDGRADGLRTEKDGVKFLCVWSGFREKSRPWFTRAMLINVDWM